MKKSFIGVELVTVARPVYEAHFQTTLCESNAMWESLKAANNSPIKMLGVIQVDIGLGPESKEKGGGGQRSH